MTRNEEEQILSLTKDNNKMLRDIWSILTKGTPNDDTKDFLVNIIANLIANKIEGYGSYK